MSTWSCLQDILKGRAGSETPGCLKFYSQGNTNTPREISYQSLYSQAKGKSTILRKLPTFERNSLVLLHFDDHWDTVLWFWSVLLAHGIPVLSSPFSNVEDHRRRHIQGLAALLNSPICLTRDKSLHLFGDDHNLHLNAVESFIDRAVVRSPSPEVQASVDNEGENDVKKSYVSGPAVLMLTSGSTGSAKAVELTHKQMLASVAGKSLARTLPQDRPFLNWIGLDHVGALLEIHLHALWHGVDQIHVSAADVIAYPTTFLDLLSRHKVSRSFAPNFFLARLVSTVDYNAMHSAWDLSSLSFLVSGGEANDIKTCVEVASLLRKYGAPPNVIAPGFGMTETCAGSIYNVNCPEYDVANGYSVASLGKCIKGMEMRITIPGTNTREALNGEFGELEVRGPVVFGGYYKNTDATARAYTPDGWFRTGDQAAIDLNGNLTLMGRVNDVININGIKVDTADVQTPLEQALQARVARLVVFATRTRHTEQVTVAYIPKDFWVDAQEVLEIDILASEICILHTSSRPLVFALQEKTLPLLYVSTLGKISRSKMRLLFEAGKFDEALSINSQMLKSAKEATYGKGQPPANEAELRLLDDFADTLGISLHTFGIDTPFFELGFTSMDLIKLKHRLDARLATEVPIVVMLKNPTARALAAALGSDPSHNLSPSAVTYDPVVEFQKGGTKTPLWLVHPGVGEVLVFVALAQHMRDDDRPLFALRARGFEEGQTCFASITETVNLYTSAIQKRQPQGPYAIAGYSYGAMIAFEIAKKLDAEKGMGTVHFVGSFNLPPHIKLRMRQLNWNTCLLNLAYFLGLTSETYAYSIDEVAFRGMSGEAALDQILDAADQVRLRELVLGRPSLRRWVDVAYGLQSMATDYDPSGKVEAIDVFCAKPLKAVAPSRDVWVRDHLSKWSDFCRSKPIIHEVEGAHYTMIGADYVLGFSAKLKSALRARGV